MQDAKQYRRDTKNNRGENSRQSNIMERLKNRRDDTPNLNRNWSFRQPREIPIALLNKDKKIIAGDLKNHIEER